MKNIVYSRILLTHDGSKLASTAVPHALALAVQFKSEVLLLQVIDSVEQEMVRLQADGTIPVVASAAESVKENVAANKKTAKQQLEKIAGKLKEKGVQKLKILVAEGFADRGIVDVAKKQRCDLVVMSTHGRSGLGRVLLGSVADHVLRHAKCPVLLVHPSRQ